MKLATAVIILACSLLVCADVITLSHIVDYTPNPNDIFKQVQFRPLNALTFAEPVVVVSLDQINVEYHGVAYGLAKKLYPHFSVYPVSGCSYSTLGLIRYYSIAFDVPKESKVAKVAVQTTSTSKSAPSSEDQKDGFEQVSVEWAQKDPKITYALNVVIKSNWNTILGNPLVSCWSKPVLGVHSYRFYFQNIKGKFQFTQSDDNQNKSEDSKYYVEVAPVFTVTTSATPSEYKSVSLEEFKKNVAYPKIVEALTKELGKFDENWVVNFQVAVINQTNCYKIVINFQPFLLKQTYEAYYYGSVEKAALLKVDEVSFNGNGKSFSNWQNIQKFNSYKAFHDAHAYILSQFTWVRFYKVVSAYSALHKAGRYVRLVYQGIKENNIDEGNQINIVTYIDECGKYFIDRNDFLATHLNSYGRNDWVSLFIATPDATKAQFYQHIVKFFKSIYPKFWSANQLVDIKFKDNLHVIQFKNPTNLCHAVLSVDDSNTVLLSRVNWTRLSDDSPLIKRVQSYAKGKYNVSKIMFIQYLEDKDGTHFEVSYLDAKNNFAAAYILYIQATDVFTNDNAYRFEPATYSNYPLPADVKGSIQTFITKQDDDLIAVVGFVALSSTSFSVVGVSSSGRWQFTVHWNKDKWEVVSKEPASDGYFRALGYPSSLIASCTGFLSRLYPLHFLKGYRYVLIETKTVGVNIFVRNIYNFGGFFVQSVVQVAYGVESSEVLHEWTEIKGLKFLEDYGYGKIYNYSYDLDESKFYQSSASKKGEGKEKEDKKDKKEKDDDECPAGTRRNIFHQCAVVFA